MDIEIQNKAINPLLNRTDIHFKVVHTGEQTPKRELIRSELADKLKVKKDQIIIDNMKSSFGLSHTQGYAKIYKNTKEAQAYERKHILKRNHALPGGAKAKEEKPAEETKPETPPAEPASTTETKEEPPKKEEKKPDEQPPKEKKE